MRPSRSASLWSRLGVALAGTAMLVGCQPPPKPPPPPTPAPPVPTADQAMTTQQQLMAIDPHAKVGQVEDVATGSHMAVVTGIPIADVKVGDIVSFTGPDRRPFANGTVTQLADPDRTHPVAGNQFPIVKYDANASGGRDPVKGDLAIIVPLGR